MSATLVRSLHPYAFRSSEWAQIIADDTVGGRACWLVVFEDGVTDVWVQDDSEADYEFAAQTTPEEPT